MMKKIATEGLNNPPQPGTPTTIPEFADNKNVANQATKQREASSSAAASSAAASSAAPASSAAASSSAAADKGDKGKGTGKGQRQKTGKAKPSTKGPNTTGARTPKPSTNRQGTGQRRQGARQSALPEHHQSGSGSHTRRSFQDINQRVRVHQNPETRRPVVLRAARSRSPRFIDQSEL